MICKKCNKKDDTVCASCECCEICCKCEVDTVPDSPEYYDPEYVKRLMNEK